MRGSFLEQFKRGAGGKGRGSSLFINTVSAMSSALWPVTMVLTPSMAAPLSRACLLKTPQKVPSTKKVPVSSEKSKQAGKGRNSRLTVVFAANNLDNLVHRPPIELLVRHYLEGKVILLLAAVPLDSLDHIQP